MAARNVTVRILWSFKLNIITVFEVHCMGRGFHMSV